ncbi:arylamine N-acetyltransferase family protein [Streptomyces sp. 1331.2]|uniref:arylamine N-acetyltransferase family protein n=1 Tax=Streptomyces sp. 1331.2 TaxID=1938835 RepID=UPI000BD4AF74|nr:arylamine N-acetyltransferase [Streptomyces sp. 1331.2]SOB83809.1 N-hydroxyarylamine O-acetyltransferase [Streptomyces sp. 1331.2]
MDDVDHDKPYEGLTAAERTAYLAHIDVPDPGEPSAPALARLQRAHLRVVPFENLSIHLGEPVVLDPQALVAKVVDRRRGGFCYELNGAFAELLRSLGYRVSLLSGRVFDGERPGPPFDHLALRVDLDEPWLVDVGFGRFSLHPLRLDERGPQPDPHGAFTVVPYGPHGELDVLLDGAPQYRLDPRPYPLADFAPTCWWQSTSPDSHFTRSTTCSLLTGDGGRITLSGTRLIRTAPDGTRTERELTEAETPAAYREHFGITLDRLPGRAAGGAG